MRNLGDPQSGVAKKRTDGIDTDVLVSIFSCKSFGCVYHGGFAGVVPDETRSWSSCAYAGDVDH
jgi:hypothetical protein